MRRLSAKPSPSDPKPLAARRVTPSDPNESPPHHPQPYASKPYPSADRYEGHRFNGHWLHGARYVANWGRGHGADNGRWIEKRASITGRGSADMGLPRICIWESDGDAGDITCDIVDSFETTILYRNEGSGRSPPCCLSPGEAKRPGRLVAKGHRNYDLMLNLQLGIRYSVGRAGVMRELRQSDFDPRRKFWTRFPPEGSKSTPPHQSVEFWWKDYCPMVFGQLRRLFSVDPADYMVALCGDDALRELSSPGKSGSSFYLTQDDRFMIKTVKKSEVKVLIRMLRNYYQHVCRYENSLLTRFYGVHCVKPVGGPKVRFIVMANLFCSEYQIHRRFDLKGSSHGRTTDKARRKIDETTTFKDLDLNFIFRLQKSWHQELLEQIKRDCEFLEAEGIMDYSLLVGLHICDDNTVLKGGQYPFFTKCCGDEIFQYDGAMLDLNFLESASQDVDRFIDTPKHLTRLGSNMPARAEHVTRTENELLLPAGGLFTPTRSGELHDAMLYFGIIDILQDYDITKKLEHAYKSLQADPNSISAVDPKLYSRRFQDFISRIFVEDEV